jgi:hypothetical protein
MMNATDNENKKTSFQSVLERLSREELVEFEYIRQRVLAIQILENVDESVQSIAWHYYMSYREFLLEKYGEN